MKSKTQPFIKWAGGKRWLSDSILGWSPTEYNTYIEPFLGGASTFFALSPKKSILSDVNIDLINTYRCVRDFPDKIQCLLEFHQSKHSKQHYYDVRSLKPDNSLEQAARFLYLNRSCWNGLYRVNTKGEFNVPIGTKNQIIFDNENFHDISQKLLKAEIDNCDFEDTINKSGENDLIYVDPPYTVKHDNNGFLKYNQSIFSWEDQIRLKDACFSAKMRGATVIISNADHESIRDLYSDADLSQSVSRASVIAGKSIARGKTSEFFAILRAS